MALTTLSDMPLISLQLDPDTVITVNTDNIPPVDVWPPVEMTEARKALEHVYMCLTSLWLDGHIDPLPGG